MQPSDLLQQLEAIGIETINNQAVSDGMAIGCDVTSMCGSPIGDKSVIEGIFTSTMPESNNAQLEDSHSDLSFDLPTIPDIS